MNFLGKWGKKFFILGLSSLVLDLIFRLEGITFLDDLGGSFINIGLTIVGAIGIYIDRNLNPEIKANQNGLSVQMTAAILEEKRAKKITEWNISEIQEYLKQTLENNKFSIWVQSKQILISEDFSINLNIDFTGRDELISPTQEITLKAGKKFIQNKNEFAIKKEFSDKVFLCAGNLIEELFEKIIKLNSLQVNIKIPENNFYILEVGANREQFSQLKETKISNIQDKLKFFNSLYNFDNKNFDFKEIPRPGAV